MSVFVNYGGPKLDKKQKQLVRSQAMVSVRGQQKLARAANAHQRGKSDLVSRLDVQVLHVSLPLGC